MRYENPTIVWVRQHVSGFPEIGIGYKDTIRFYIVGNHTASSEAFKRKKIEIEGKEFQTIRNRAQVLRAKHVDDELCACGSEPMGKDRGIPVCEWCWDQQSDASLADSEKYSKRDTTTIKIEKTEKKNAYEIMFDL